MTCADKVEFGAESRIRKNLKISHDKVNDMLNDDRSFVGFNTPVARSRPFRPSWGRRIKANEKMVDDVGRHNGLWRPGGSL